MALSSLETEEMELMETVSRESTYLLEQGEKHLSEKLDATMRLKKHRELAEAAQRKIRHMQIWLASSLKGREDARVRGENQLIQGEFAGGRMVE